MNWNQLGRTLVKIYYVALAVPKFAGLFAISSSFSVLDTVLFSSYLQTCDILFKAHHHAVTESLLQSDITAVRHKNQY